MNERIKICFLADKHGLYDDRIYWKMSVPLKEKGYDVYYLLIGDEEKSGITAEGIKYDMLKIKTFSGNRYLNFILKIINPYNNYKKLFKKASNLEADIYHFHDLWINRIAKKLKFLKNNPVVFYDAREPYAEDYISYIKAKGIFKYMTIIFSKLVDNWEKHMSKNYDLIISNEEIVRDKFRKKLGNKKVEVLFNYTDIYKDYNDTPSTDKVYDFIYCGGITELRGAFKIIKATEIALKKMPNIKVVLLGKYSPATLKKDLQDYININKLQKNVELLSEVSYSEVSKFYNKSKIGLVTLLRSRTFEISMPIKVFEYMAFGLPIIGSNFGHIKKYIEKENCGITVDPDNPENIANAMIELLTNEKKYEIYSKNGRRATLAKYKWDIEFNRLLDFYTKALYERESNR
jgi:glycosyltransferase involved in cell wall biosynthesis